MHRPPSSKLAITGFLLALFGLCFFPIAGIGALLGVLALAKISKSGGTVGGKGLAIASLALAGVSIVTTGVLAAIAVPAFITYTRRSKAHEAHASLSLLHAGLSDRVTENGSTPGSAPYFPPSLARTPSVPTCQKQEWPASADPAWAELGFRPNEYLYYAYEIESHPETRTATLRATGDLDCDGTFSRYELDFRVDSNGVVQPRDRVRIENETE